MHQARSTLSFAPSTPLSQPRTKHEEPSACVSSPSPRLGWWIAIFVLAMVLTQFLSSRMKPEKQRPGTERNDLVLNKDHLPQDMHGWKQSSFEAAKPAEQLTEGQFWWTHSWIYAKPPLTAYVALDQADWTSWHELTICYQAIGWTLVDRRLVDPGDPGEEPDNHWPTVVARLEKSTLEKATLIFSMFGQDGTPLVSPVFNIAPEKVTTTEKTIIENFADRLNYRPANQNLKSGTTSYDRVIQCQVLIRHTQDLPEATLADLIDLHQQTRGLFRAAWHVHHSNLTPAN